MSLLTSHSLIITMAYGGNIYINIYMYMYTIYIYIYIFLRVKNTFLKIAVFPFLCELGFAKSKVFSVVPKNAFETLIKLQKNSQLPNTLVL